MIKICLTGGPCSGKTTALEHLVKLIESKGYICLVCEEAATSLINGGIKPYKDGLSMKDFQRFVIKKQLANEEILDALPPYVDNNKIVALYDRGFGDHTGYIGKKVFEELLMDTPLTIDTIYSRYDYVFFMVSAANGAVEYYQWNDPSKEDTGNNAARYESPEEAADLDNRLYDAWKDHPQFKVFDNSTDFKTKIKNVLKETENILENQI